MFGTKSFGNNNAADSQKNKPRKASAAKDTAVTILTSGCHFVGKLYCRGSSRIGGRIEGEIISEGLLIVEDEAVIQAEIKAEEVVVQGRISGRLDAKGRIELHPSSHFQGDISTPILIISEGAQFNGSCTMTNAEQSNQQGRNNDSGKGNKVVNMRQGPDATPGRQGKGDKDNMRDVAVVRDMLSDGDLTPSLT